MDGKSWSLRLAALRRRNRAQGVLYISTNFFHSTFNHGSFWREKVKLFLKIILERKLTSALGEKLKNMLRELKEVH